VTNRCTLCDRPVTVSRSGRCDACRWLRDTGAPIDATTPWERDDRCWYVVACHPTGITLDQIGTLLGLCRERIRQIERDALRKLAQAHPELRGYLAELDRRWPSDWDDAEDVA